MPFRRKRTTATHQEKDKTFLDSWGPPILTGAIAFIASIALAYFNAESSEKTLYLELRIKHADQATMYLETYVATWGRFIAKCKIRDQQIAEDKRNEAQLSSEQKASNEAIEKKRLDELEELAKKQLSPSGDALGGEFAALNLYFTEDLVAKVDEFRKWDDKYRRVKCSELPGDNAEWRKLQSNLISQLRAELNPGGVNDAERKK